jgi:hypothetical protein
VTQVTNRHDSPFRELLALLIAWLAGQQLNGLFGHFYIKKNNPKQKAQYKNQVSHLPMAHPARLRISCVVAWTRSGMHLVRVSKRQE